MRTGEELAVLGSFSDVEVAVKEVSLSILGWEVQDFRARVTTTQDFRGNYDHELSISGVFHFNKDDWTDCFGSRDSPVRPVMVVSVPKHSPWRSITAFNLRQPRDGQVSRIAQNQRFLTTLRPIDHSEIQIEITGYDWISASSLIAEIPRGVEKVPIEVQDETTAKSISLIFDEATSFTYCNLLGKRDYGQLLASGRVAFGTAAEILADCTPGAGLSKAPFTRRAPTIGFEVFDETGFLLERVNSYLSINIPVDADGQTPSRSPRWLASIDFNLFKYTALPSRVIARIEDA